MLIIRLTRGGKKNSPLYRIVVSEKRTKNFGEFCEVLGSYDPKKKNLKIDKDKYQDWVAKGAKATPSVKKII